MSKRSPTAHSPNISVDRRLFLLVLTELFTAVLLIGAAVITLRRLASERDYMDRYVFAPVVDIGEAMGTITELHNQVALPPADPAASARGPVLRLQGFVDRYRRYWETGTSDMPEMARLRAELERQGESRLLEQEHQMVEESVAALRGLAQTAGLGGAPPATPPIRREDLLMLDSAIDRLNRLNLRYVQVAYKAFERTHRHVTAFFFAVSAASLLAATLLGLAVRRAIGPRVRRMAQAVERFRGTGNPVSIDDRGDDDLGILAGMLDLSFRGIAAREKEQERFLAIAAHELKTPLTTLKGFAQTALAHRDEPAVVQRALTVIDRQATRLARLTQDLLWSARADAGRLPFHPGPIDLDALARRVVGEVEVVCTGHAFLLTSDHGAHLLGDAALLEQALWNMLVQAATLAPEGDSVRLTLDGTATRTRVTVEARTDLRLPDDIDELAEPFAALPFERRGEARSTGLGLYLVRVIARLHGASFHLERAPGGLFAAVLDLQR